MNRELKVHLEGLKLDTLQEVTIAADEYTLSHRSLQHSGFKGQGFQKRKSPSRDNSPKQGKGRGSPGKGSPSRGSPNRGSPKRGSVKGSPKKVECFFCHKNWHVRVQCYKYKNFIEEEKRPIGLLASNPGKEDVCVPKGFKRHMSVGKASINAKRAEGRKVPILRDTEALQSLILRLSLPNDFNEEQSEYILLGGFPDTVSSYPREKVYPDSEWSKGIVKLAIVEKLPVRGVDVELANDLTDGDSERNPVVDSKSGEESPIEFMGDRSEYPIKVLICSKVQAVDIDETDLNNDVPITTDISELPVASIGKVSWENEFRELENVEEEPREVMKPVIRWYNGILYRFSRKVGAPAESSEVRRQIVVPEKYRKRLLWLSHEDHLSGHFGVRKTFAC